jgi:CRISPR/Cas system Type II protein with McrA/HNH and RuvC-like nuclease domain
MKHILGLDIGTNSLGWYLLKLSGQKYEIVDRGVVVFPIGTIVDPVKGLEKTKHAQRRQFRLTARNRFRKKLRKWKLSKLLSKVKFYPERLEAHDFQYKDTYGLKNYYQSFELYQLRAKALDNQIKPEEIGRLLFLLNNYRGFKSSSKSLADEIDNKKNDDEGKVKNGIETLNSLMLKAEARTYGEYFYKMHLIALGLYNEGKWHNPNEPVDERAFGENGELVLTNSHGIRRENGRYTSRAIYENEFDLIWEEQKKHYPDVLTGSRLEYDTLQEKLHSVNKEERKRLVNQFKHTLFWQIKYATIYYQRPLKSAKKYIGKCPYNRNKRTAPASAGLFQSFRIWKQLADIRYTNKENDVFNEPLSIEWRKAIFSYLHTNPVVHLKSGKGKTGICELLDLDEKKIVFNFDNAENDKYVKGNTTSNALFRALGNDTYEKLKSDVDKAGNSKLEKLWHLLYMKKDDEWLKITLHDKSSWPLLSPEQIEKLVEIALEDGYAPYSSKLLTEILPYMENGDDEHTALKKASYIEIDQTFNEAKWSPAIKISGIKNGDLRNPVVEKAVNETILLVNAILEKHPEIDKSNWEVHIETTRELKKPKKEREKMRRENTAKDEVRQEYANFLNEQRSNGKLKGLIKSEIFKNSPIINKFELWLEMGGDKNDPEFSEFAKLERLDFEKRIKHKLWLECNRICPYTGEVINLTRLFSPDIEIEHIIPLSRGLDNSFGNKTLTSHYINKEKGNKTSFEYLKHDKKTFEKRIKAGNFSKEKIENFLRENVPIEFTHAQIGNTSYIAKFVREKIQEVSKPHLVNFTNGKVTSELRSNDWRLGNLLDKIRYEDATGIDIDSILKRFNVLKKYFHSFYKKKMGKDIRVPKSVRDFNQISESLIQEFDKETNDNLAETLSGVEKFEAFRGAKGKKDRSDHRHHALDALITALCSPSVTKTLSTYNAAREQSGISLYSENGELNREKIELPIDYASVKDSLKDILVVNKTNQRLIVAKKNKIKTKEGFVTKSSTSIRASLHADTYYGKLKNPELQGINKPEAYVTRFSTYVWDFDNSDKLDSIYDKDLREIIRRRILWFKEKGITIGKEAYEQYPLYRYSPKIFPNEEPEKPTSKKKDKPLPVVKKVRTLYKNYRSIIELPKSKFADNDGNYIMALYELVEKDKKGKVKIARDFRVLSSYEAIVAKNEGKELFPDEVVKDGKYLPLMTNCPFLKPGDMVIMLQDGEEKESINWNNYSELKARLFKVVMLSSEEKYGLIGFLKHSIAPNKMSYPKGAYEKGKKQIGITMRHTQINAIRVKIDSLGRLHTLA